MSLKITLLIYIIITIIFAIRKSRKTNLKFATKEAINKSRALITIPFIFYFVIGGISLIPIVSNWTTEQLTKYPLNSDSYFAISWAPRIALITITYFAVKIMNSASKPWINYTKEEQIWIDESNAKLKKNTDKIKAFLHIKKSNINKNLTGGS